MSESNQQTKVELAHWLDADVLDFDKSHGDDYQTLMNAVLRSYMEQVQKTQAPG